MIYYIIVHVTDLKALKLFIYIFQLQTYKKKENKKWY